MTTASHVIINKELEKSMNDIEIDYELDIKFQYSPQEHIYKHKKIRYAKIVLPCKRLRLRKRDMVKL